VVTFPRIWKARLLREDQKLQGLKVALRPFVKKPRMWELPVSRNVPMAMQLYSAREARTRPADGQDVFPDLTWKSGGSQAG
jgi:hypothetical protein